MTDLAILVPSRGRPASVARLAEACEKTCRTSYLLVFGFDDDDPDHEASIAAVPRSARYSISSRRGLVEWTNKLARAHMDAAYLASVGDDMIPETDGWDEQLITAIEHQGGGYAYPNDLHRADIPEAVVVSRRVVAALGWMALPALRHFYCDDVWGALGKGAGCLAYLPGVVVRHAHPNADPAVKPDQTYADAAGSFAADRAAYRKWRLYRMPRDIEAVKACLSPRS